MQETNKLMKNNTSLQSIGAGATFSKEQFTQMLLTGGIQAADGKYRTHASLDMSNKASDSNGEKIVLSYDGSKSTDKDKSGILNGEIKLLANIEGSAETNFDLKWDTKAKGDTAAKSVSTQFNMNYSDGISLSNNFSLNGELTDNASENEKAKSFKDDIALSAYIIPGRENQGQKFGGKLNLVIERAYDVDFKLPEFDSGKIVDLSTVDGNQLMEICSQAGVSLVDLINNPPWLNDYFDLSFLTYMFGETE